MTRFFSGYKPGVGPVLKIMLNDADDTLTTPNTDYGKYGFNSEVQKVGYIVDIFAVEPDFTTYPSAGGGPSSPNTYFLPSGSNKYNCEVMIHAWDFSGNSFQRWYYFQAFFTANYGFAYYPLVEVRPTIGNLPNKFRGPYVDLATGEATERGQVYSYSSYTSRTMTVNDTGEGGPAPGRNRAATMVSVTSSGATIPISRALVSVFNLPMEADAIPNYAGTPVEGQEVIRIGNTGEMARIALPGYTVNDGDPNHFILHEDKIPAKVMRAGTVSVSAGGSAIITTPLPMTAMTYMDYMAKRSSEATFWSPPFISSMNESQSLDFNYTVGSTTLTIVSASQHDLDIVYVIYADSGEAPTTGGSKILYEGNDGTRDFIQVKRPGSSDVAPNLNDIMLDTRLTYLPILAEGFLDWPADFPTVLSGGDLFKGERKTTITVTNPDGLLLFPKAGAVYNPSPVITDSDEPHAIWGEHAVIVNASPRSGTTTGYSTWANPVDSTHVDIFGSNNNPYSAISDFDFYDAQLKGVRYYIFGIQQSL